MTLASLGILAAALLGLSDEITLQPSRGDRLHAAWQLSLSQLNRPSARTDETLKRYDVADRYRKDPAGALATLEKLARRGPEPELIYALAELSWIAGRQAEGKRRGGGDALASYVDTVAYAFDYLYDPELEHGRSPTDPRFRLACDLYNAALDRLIRAARTKDRLQPGDSLRLKIHGSTVEMRLALWEETPWKSEDIDELILASDFEVTGLDSRSRRYGLGVPLIAVKRSDGKNPGAERFLPAEMAFPLTAILRPDRPLRDVSNVDTDGVRACTIDLVDPIQKRTVGTGTSAIALEADITTPLAYMWSRTDLNSYRWSGLLRPGQAAGRAGLMLLRPFEQGKIPVVMVHGLASTPLAWIPMLNELLRDPLIQARYQFFLYLYPTGMPLPIAASGLRDALEDARRHFATASDTSALEGMVLLGHSMGGLLSHAMSVRSDDWLWRINSDRRFDEIIGPPEVLAELEHYSFFDWLPYVRCVVFLATPHRGSEMSRGFLARLGSNLIAEPDHYTRLLAQLVKDNPDAFPRRFRHPPTSIETLDLESPVLDALLRMTKNPKTTYHSIIGSLRPEGVASTTDGIVAYKSAHLDGVPERVVRSDHGVQKDPEAIREVRRILLDHLRLMDSSGAIDAQLTPASHP
jgi:pimeloyl-ACP methyl ester carboxylesterase